MPSTNSAHPFRRNQFSLPDSPCETDRRLNDIQSDFVAIAYALGDARQCLANRDRWYEACRDPRKGNAPCRPWVMEDAMIDDAVRTVAARGTDSERKATRSAVVQYFTTRCKLSLEMLGEVEDGCPVKLTLESTREVAEAQHAAITAITSKTPESRDRAARETTEALTVLERLRNSFYTPRGNALFKVAR